MVQPGHAPLAGGGRGLRHEAGGGAGAAWADRGLHIIKLEERKESSARKFEEVKNDLRNTLYGQKMEAATKAWLTELRKKAHIDVQ